MRPFKPGPESHGKRQPWERLTGYHVEKKEGPKRGSQRLAGKNELFSWAAQDSSESTQKPEILVMLKKSKRGLVQDPGEHPGALAGPPEGQSAAGGIQELSWNLPLLAYLEHFYTHV